jgi:hypothetical protein
VAGRLSVLPALALAVFLLSKWQNGIELDLAPCCSLVRTVKRFIRHNRRAPLPLPAPGEAGPALVHDDLVKAVLCGAMDVRIDASRSLRFLPFPLGKGLGLGLIPHNRTMRLSPPFVYFVLQSL